MVTIKIIRPSSRESTNLLPDRVKFLETKGFSVTVDEAPTDSSWTYTAGNAQRRSEILSKALMDDMNDIILCARGGYGASDLLPLMPWEKIKSAKEKLLCGFSDISALHSALFTQANWQGLHGPMPATALWDESKEDISKLLQLFVSRGRGEALQGALTLQPVSDAPAVVSGKIFGGCFTVLTNLIGTPYFPKNLENHIVFIEDTDENPARLMRALNQWIQSGAIKGASALVIGHLRSLGEKIEDCADYVYEQFAKRVDVPVFRSRDFGHTSPNFPLLVGGYGTIEKNQLSWHSQGRSIA